MKIVIKAIFILLFFTCKNLYAQRCDTASFQSRYWIENQGAEYITKLIAQPDGNIFITGGIKGIEDYSPDIGDACITKITEKGTVLWSKKIGYAGSLDWPYDAKGTTDGGCVIAGVTQSQGNSYGDAWIVKLDADASIEWSFVFGSPASILRNVIQLSDGGYVAVGQIWLSFDSYAIYKGSGFIVRLDRNGKIIWSKSFLINRDINYFSSIKELHDGNLLVFGGGHNILTAPYDGIVYIVKIGRNDGQIIWSNTMPEGYNPGLDETVDNNIRITWRNIIYYFDADGKNIRNVEFTLPNYLADKEILHITAQVPGEDYYVIKQASNPILFKVKNDSAVAWARSYRYKSSPGFMIEFDDAIFANNAFYLGSAINMQYFPDSIYKSSDLPYVMKTYENGQTPCSDTFEIPFSFTKLPLLPDQPSYFKEDLQPRQSAAGMYSQYVIPHGVIDCASITCCRDTVMYKKVALCEGSHYILPDGRIIDTAGIFPVTLKTYKGCDSVIFTIASQQQNIKVSLGNDTCFTHTYGITYRLSLPGQVQYQWQDGNTNAEYTAMEPGQYWVRATSACNASIDSVIIYKDCDFPVYIPNAFTPNNDGLNDIFRIAGLRGQQLLNLSIYNRFGERIFFTSTPDKGWDGIINGIQQTTGTYIYLVRYMDIGGRRHELKGTVVLIR